MTFFRLIQYRERCCEAIKVPFPAQWKQTVTGTWLASLAPHPWVAETSIHNYQLLHLGKNVQDTKLMASTAVINYLQNLSLKLQITPSPTTASSVELLDQLISQTFTGSGYCAGVVNANETMTGSMASAMKSLLAKVEAVADETVSKVCTRFSV